MKPGKILQTLRAKNNLTQKNLADKIGLKPIDISDFENDKKYPDKETIMKLKKVLEDFC